MEATELRHSHYDYLIVGAGIFGATAARALADHGRSVLVVEKRDHIGGNVYTEDIEGVCVHMYGPHIFHTDSEEVWTFVNRFARFNNYVHRPLASWHGELYSLPFNMNTFREMWGVTEPEEARRIIEGQAAAYRTDTYTGVDEVESGNAYGNHLNKCSGSSDSDHVRKDTDPVTYDTGACLKSHSHIPVNKVIRATCSESGEDNLSNHSDCGNCISSLEMHAISMVGTDIYEKMIRGYTEKQWGRPCSELPASIIRRIPIRYEYNNNYFDDRYQGIPVSGYTDMIAGMLDGIEVMTGVDFLDPAHRGTLEACADRIIYTGQIDAYYDYCYGPLEYRGLRFETEVAELYRDASCAVSDRRKSGTNTLYHHNDNENITATGYNFTAHYQPAAVVNYTDKETPWTRVVEHSWFSETEPEGTYPELNMPVTGSTDSGMGRARSGYSRRDTTRCITVITREYPAEWNPGDEAFYPVNDAANQELYERYLALAGSDSKVIFGGRLGSYRYYDMDDAVEAALALAASI